VSTRTWLPLGLAISLMSGVIAAFYVHYPELEAAYEPAQAIYTEMEEPLSVIQQQTANISDAFGFLGESASQSSAQLQSIHEILTELAETAAQEAAFDAAQHDAINELVNISKQQNEETGDVLSEVLSNMLGKPIGQTYGDRSVVKVYSLQEAGYRGYLAKVKLKDPSAVKLVLSHDKIGDKGETTSSAAKRTGAVLAVNAGGFAKKSDGLLYPMGVTVVDGEIVTFYQTGLSFIGFNKDGKLVGGEINSREDVEELEVESGATFVPTLLKDGKKLSIPAKWKNKREPRTMIGHFSNGDLLFIVIDGRQKGYSNGVTLEEAQEKLLEWNVRDAYNLDGGGSSTFVYDGEVLNSPSDGQERKVISYFVVMP